MRDLGVSDRTLRNWIKQADVDAGKREGLGTDEREEPFGPNELMARLRAVPGRLRRENRTLCRSENPKKSRGLLRREIPNSSAIIRSDLPEER